MKRCDHCDEAIRTDEWYPTIAREVADGITLYSFCCVSCRDAWLSTADET